MTKEEIIKYVTSSPENTNPNVLEGMLEELDNGSGSNGLSEAVITLNITPPSGITLNSLTYSQDITINNIVFSSGLIAQNIFDFITVLVGEAPTILTIEAFSNENENENTLYVIDADASFSGNIDRDEDGSFIVNGNGTISGNWEKVESLM